MTRAPHLSYQVSVSQAEEKAKTAIKGLKIESGNAIYEEEKKNKRRPGIFMKNS
jgi:hypothetical protein